MESATSIFLLELHDTCLAVKTLRGSAIMKPPTMTGLRMSSFSSALKVLSTNLEQLCEKC